MFFASDNGYGAAPDILQAIVDSNDGTTPAYGNDILTRQAEEALSRTFEREVAVFLVSTGTAANAIALGAMTPPWGAILCHRESHINEDEGGAPEFFTGGGKFIGLEGVGAKITMEALEAQIAAMPPRFPHRVPPRVLSLSQTTECGQVYRRADIEALAARAHAAGMRVHMDGARFANAIASLNAAPADITWKAGIDVLSFGATKGGAIACEAIVVFDKMLAETLHERRKRGGHLFSKHRFLAAQMIAYLKDDRWIELARAANDAARRLADALLAVPGVRLGWPVEANAVFPIMPRALADGLHKAGLAAYPWSPVSLPHDNRLQDHEVILRMLTSYATPQSAIDAVAKAAQTLCKS